MNRIFLRNRFINLDCLLRPRYDWSNNYINPGKVIIEIGAAAGFTLIYLNRSPKLTDEFNRLYFDSFIDAINMDFSNSLDILIALTTNTIFAAYIKFFKECERVRREYK